MSLRTRITLATTIALAVVAIASSIVIWSAVRAQLRASVEEQLRQIAQAPTDRRDGPRLAPRPDAGRGVDRFGGARGVRQIVLGDGTVIGELGAAGDRIPVDHEDMAIARRGRGERVRDIEANDTHVLVLTIGTERGALQVARPLGEVDQVLDRVALALVVITGFGIVLAVFLGRLVAGVALRPVARFTDEAEQIASGSDARSRLDADARDEIGRLAVTFNQTLDALEASIDSQRRLIADAGHELRTPIASIRANIQLLDQADRLPEEDLVAIRSDIITELDELTELLADVIELARGSDPDAPLDEVRLDELLQTSAQRAARRGDSAVTLDLDIEPTVVVGDGARIGRAIANVIDNARKWSPPGGIIHVQLRDGIIIVRDEGPGVPESDLPHVWDRFHRAATARSMPGSGLGLSIVRQTVEAHGGSAHIENAPQGGTIVTLQFGPWTAPDDAPELVSG